MNEVRVRVIDDVVDVEAALDVGEGPRIVPLTGDEPIDHRRLVPTDDGHTRQATRHWRADQRRRDRLAMLVTEMLEQHLGHQIHAGPAFLEIVGNHRNTQTHVTPPAPEP